MKSIGTILVFFVQALIGQYSAMLMLSLKKKKNIEEKLGKLTLDQTGTALFSVFSVIITSIYKEKHWIVISNTFLCKHFRNVFGIPQSINNGFQSLTVFAKSVHHRCFAMVLNTLLPFSAGNQSGTRVQSGKTHYINVLYGRLIMFKAIINPCQANVLFL